MYVLFFLAWIIFNGQFTLEIAILGVAVATVMFAFMCKFMDYSIKKELNVYKKSIWFFAYIVLLLREIVKANLEIIPRILTIEEEMEPVIVKFKTNLKSDFTRMLLAEGLENSDFEKALMKLDEEE